MLGGVELSGPIAPLNSLWQMSLNAVPLIAEWHELPAATGANMPYNGDCIDMSSPDVKCRRFGSTLVELGDVMVLYGGRVDANTVQAQPSESMFTSSK